MIEGKEFKELEQDVIDFYNKIDKATYGRYKEFDWRMIKVIGGVSGKKILNMGCSYPIDEIEIAKEADFWLAVDFAPKQIEKCHSLQEAGKIPSKVTFFCQDIANMSVEDNQFDIVLSFSTIDHIPDPEKRIQVHKEAYRVLKDNGHLIISFPNFRYPKYGGKKYRTDKFGYEYHYTPEELLKELQEVGFKCILFDGVDDDIPSLTESISSRVGMILIKEV